MGLLDGGKINEGISYKVEFSRGEEVAELGERAPKEVFTLPEWSFDEDKKELLFAKLETVMEEKNYDTAVIQKETFEEFVYHKTES